MAQEMTTNIIQVSSTNSPKYIAHSKRKHAGTDGDGGRKRVSQACDKCRNKKLKCDGLRPACSSCVSQGRECLYGTVLKKRGLPEGYVRGLERLLGLLISKEEAESVASIFQDSLDNEITKADLIRQWNGEGIEGETLAEIWRSSRLSKALEQLLPELDAPYIKGQDVKRPRLEPHAVDYRREKSDVAQLFLAKPLPPQEVAETLFNVYFGYTHCWLPIIGKDEILATYYRTLELSECSLEPGQHAVLWAVFACGAIQRPSDQQDAAGKSAGKSYYQKARSLIPSEDSGFQVGHVQALLLLALVQLNLGQLSACWLLVGQASNLAIDLRLGKSDLSGDFNNRRRHVFLGCFCLDTLIATMLGRYPHFRKEDAEVLGKVDENGLEEWGHLDLADRRIGERPGPARSISIFNQFTRLVCIMNDIVRGVPTGEDREQACHNFQSRLNEWKLGLPSYSTLNIDPGSSNPSSPLLPHQLNLHLTWIVCTTVLRSQFKEQRVSETFREYTQLPGHILEHFTQVSFESDTAVLPAFFALAGLVLNLDKGSLELVKGMDWRACLRELSSRVENVWPYRSAVGLDSSLKKVSNAHDDSLVLDSSKSSGINMEPNGASSLMEHSGPSTSPASSKNPKDSDFSGTGILLPSQIGVVIMNEPNAQSDLDYNIDHIVTTTPTNWGMSHKSNTCIAPLDSSKAVQEDDGGDLSWFIKDSNAYSGAGDHFHLNQSNRSSQLPVQNQVDSQSLGSIQRTLSVPDIIPASIEELTSEPALRSMIFTDDLFFELSNLDYFTGDRDETYRNLGFLLPQEDSDPFALPSPSGNNSSSNYQTFDYHPNGWPRP